MGPLHGVPMTVKESYEVSGLPTTWGVPEKKNDIAKTTALGVERLQDFGAVVFGKTNVPRMLADWQSFNEIYGTTNNPWDVTRSPGGSSGGGAAALAAGLTGLETGSDIGGSIRQPAHACGLFGHKPTWGLVPLRGHAPMPGVASTTDISCIGPLARGADDLAIGLAAMAGPDETESALAITLPAPRVRTIADLRVAVWASDPATNTDPEITAEILALAKQLKREGAKVSLKARPEIDPAAAFENFLKLLAGALSGRASPEERERMIARAAAIAPDDRSADAVIARAAPMPHGAWLGLNEQRLRMRRAWSAFFADWDVLLCPVHAVPAQPHRHEQPTSAMRITVDGKDMAWNDMMFWPGLIGGVHLPSSAAPLGLTKTGLPIGVQIVGPLYGDRTTMLVAKMLEKSWRGFVAPAGWE
jgi:amidase